jgi:amino acid permease
LERFKRNEALGHWPKRSWPYSAPKFAKMRLRLKGCMAMLFSCLICLICFFNFFPLCNFFYWCFFVNFVGFSCYHCLFIIHKIIIRRIQLKLKYEKMKSNTQQ